MKIAYDHNILRTNICGVSRYFCEIASRIAKEPGVQISITAPMYINAYLERVPRGLVSGFRAPSAIHLRLLQRDWAYSSGLDAPCRSTRYCAETYYFPYRLGPRRARRVLTIYDMINEKFTSNSTHQKKQHDTRHSRRNVRITLSVSPNQHGAMQ